MQRSTVVLLIVLGVVLLLGGLCISFMTAIGYT